MKVTVCFGNIRVVVPCGNGGLTVGELQDKACARYRKAIGKDASYWIHITQLESAVDGGILDWDDTVYDVVEDKEKLIAVFEQEEPHHFEWDLGSVASSDDPSFSQRPSVSSKPNISNGTLHDPDYSHYRKIDSTTSYNQRDNTSEVGVGVKALKSADTRVEVKGNNTSSISNTSSTDRIENSMINGNTYDPRGPRSSVSKKRSLHSSLSDEQSNNKSRSSVESKNDRRDRSYFRRNTSARQSKASALSDPVDDDDYYYNPTNSYGYDYSHLEVHDSRGRMEEPTRNHHSHVDRSDLPWFYKDAQEIRLVNDGSLQNMKVESFDDPLTKKFAGLVINSIDQSSRLRNLLECGDVIVEINDHVLMDFTFKDAKNIMFDSLLYPNIEFRVLPVEERDRFASRVVPSSLASPTRFSSTLTPSLQPIISLTTATPPVDKTSHGMAPSQNSHLNTSQSSTSVSSMSTQEPQSPKAKVPAIAQLSHDNLSSYTRKIGHRINIQLRKDIHGLGFSLTTRDTVVGDSGPIYIKNILPKGAAIQDGRLLAGDRLLEVNGFDVSGKTQEEVVVMLRGVAIGSIVNLVISRQIENLPRKMKDDPDTDKAISEDNHKEYFMFEIALNDTGSAGLGISLKGNQSKKTRKDLGIFVKAVFHGGAAWQDGRLKSNDQLIQVNGHSLQGFTNHEAIEILRQSMSTEGNVRGMIQMVIARRKPTSDGAPSRVSSEASSDLSDSLIEQFNFVAKSDVPRHLHVKQASLPSLLLVTSFGPDDMSDVTSRSFQTASTIDRPQMAKNTNSSVARRVSNHKKSRSMTGDADTIDIEVINRVREKILNSSASSFLSNLIRSSTPTIPPKPNSSQGNESYSTWTIPRTHRIPKRSLSMRSTENELKVSNSSGYLSDLIKPRPSDDSRRLAFESMTANELTSDAVPVEHDGARPTETKLSVTSLSSSEFLQLSRADSPVNPDVVTTDEECPNDAHDPFSRESTIRQSFSEKRKDNLPRFSYNADLKASKSKTNLGTDGAKNKQATTSSPKKRMVSPQSSGKRKYTTQQNNNNSNAIEIAPVSGFRKSISTESLVAGNSGAVTFVQWNKPYTSSNKLTPSDVGPTLGIAKSSSLESLQTAVESSIAQNKLDNSFPIPRPLPKVVRGRILNDSFRAALDKSYDMSGEAPSITHMSTLREEDDQASQLSLSDEGSRSRSNKKRQLKENKANKLFGIFKMNKTKRSSSSTRSPKVPENELHKRDLAARQKQDFERMKAENERIQEKFKELRNKQSSGHSRDEKKHSSYVKPDYETPRPPSVPVTAMQKIKNVDPKTSHYQSSSGRHSVDPTSLRHHSNSAVRAPPASTDKDSSPPRPFPRNKKHSKGESSQFKESKNAYSSLPRQPRRTSRNMGQVEVSKVVSPERRTSGPVYSSSSRTLDNREFYNRQKPNVNRQSSTSYSSPLATQANLKSPTSSSSFTQQQSPTSVTSPVSAHNSRKGRTLPYGASMGNGQAKNSVPKHHRQYHYREDSPEPPPQNFYVVDDRRFKKTPVTVIRRGTLTDVPLPKEQPTSVPYRHSIYTDHPSTLNYFAVIKSPLNTTETGSRDAQLERGIDRITQGEELSYKLSPRDDAASPSSSEAAEKNRSTYHKLMKGQYGEKLEESFGKIELSTPYNL
ncbi:partitioning defective 3 homolog isoform X3 [Clavelina lepadiformis]|uniref:partitioning defective 3 homolog isoform X3 n=1 Tax=Clavelina lepadiformis TaxID=159417 RepID=UPI00404325A4